MRKHFYAKLDDVRILNAFKVQTGSSHSETIRRSIQFYATAKGITVKPKKK